MRNNFVDFLKLSDEYLLGSLDYRAFSNKFEILLENGLSEDNPEGHYIWDLSDQIAYTGNNPNDEDRKYGIHDSEEFKKWLIDYKQKNIHFWKEAGLE